MRIIFAGTPAFASRALDAILRAGHEVVLVLTQPDRPAGRGMKPAASDVKQLAVEHGLDVRQPTSLKDRGVQAVLATLKADVMVVAAYGLLLPKTVLDTPRHGCLNIHASLLPRWRGAAPIQRALLAGDKTTGISIMQMDEGLDTGDVLLEEVVPIADDDTAQTLHDKLAELGASLIVEALAHLSQGTLRPVPQDDAAATYAAKLTKDEAVLDWRRSAQQLDRAVRAYNPFPVAQTSFAGGILRIWVARAASGSGVPGTVLSTDKQGILVACGKGALLLQEVQKSGGKRLPAAVFLAGNPIAVGVRLGD
jgi:methionyl-tRNA formyltransferase